MVDLDKIGGIPIVMKTLLDAGYLHGTPLTVTGKNVAENLRDVVPLGDARLGHQDVLYPVEKPFSPPGNHM